MQNFIPLVKKELLEVIMIGKIEQEGIVLQEMAK